MPNHTTRQPAFSFEGLSDTNNEYVLWMDLMGTKSSLSRSIAISSNYILKFHVACITAPHANVKIYPVMDGVYATSTRQRDIVEFAKYVLTAMADLFVSTPEQWYRVIVKGSLAYGPVIHGQSIGARNSATLDANGNYKNSILIGMPMIQAIESEHKAPPFGLYLHESTRAFAPARSHPFKRIWFSWFEWDNKDLARELRDELTSFFDWADAHQNSILYKHERITEHRIMAQEYFADI